MTQNELESRKDPTPLPFTRKDRVLSWTSFAVIIVTFLGAVISNAAGNAALMTAFSVLCTLFLTGSGVHYLSRKALHEAPQSQAVANGSSVASVVLWKTLWLAPALLLFLGMVRCIAGVTPDGILIGVIGALVGMAVLPIYAVLGIMRVVKKH